MLYMKVVKRVNPLILYLCEIMEVHYKLLWWSFKNKELNWMWVSESHSVVSDSLWPHGLYSPWNCLGQNTGVGSLSLLQGIFPTQGSNPGLPHHGHILYQLSHRGNPLKWVVILKLDNRKRTERPETQDK